MLDDFGVLPILGHPHADGPCTVVKLVRYNPFQVVNVRQHVLAGFNEC